MPRQATRQDFRTFVGGLHTEASPLSFPENTAKDLDNVDLLRDGSIKRRRGLKLEDSFTLSSDSFDDADIAVDAISVHEWTSVGGDGDLNFLVIQVGTNLYFHQLGSAITSDNLVGTISFNSLQLNSDASKERISAASGRDRLFIVSKKIEPGYIEYDVNTQTFSVTQLNLKIRDVNGIDDGLEIDERPTSLSNEHLYNLLNQGWKNPPHITNTTAQYHPDVIAYTVDLRNRYFGNLLVVTRNATGRYPSNADIWYFSKANSASRPAAIGAYNPESLHRYSFGNTAAARGHFILDAFNRDRSAKTGILDLVDSDRDIDNNRPISLEFYSGRLWYLMPDGRLLFSQVLEDIDDAEKCYQDADPTAEDINELVATDGGEMEITGIGKAIKLITAGEMLLIFADNGVWAISGAEQSAFSATSQLINKITYVGAIGQDSVVPIENTVIYWSPGGIYILNREQVSGQFQPQNITETTIQTFYENIGELGKIYARGKYDRREKKIFWLYNDDGGYDGTNDRFLYNKILIFDTVLQAFYKYSLQFNDSYPKISALVETEAFSFTTSQEDVTDNGVLVTDSSVAVTTQVISGVANAETKLKGLVLGDPVGGTEDISTTVEVSESLTAIVLGSGAPFRLELSPTAYFDFVSNPAYQIDGYELSGVFFSPVDYQKDTTGDESLDLTVTGSHWVIGFDGGSGNRPSSDLFVAVDIETDPGVFFTLFAADATFYDDVAPNHDGNGHWVWRVGDAGETVKAWTAADDGQDRDLIFYY